jgi:hypothetical protein
MSLSKDTIIALKGYKIAIAQQCKGLYPQYRSINESRKQKKSIVNGGSGGGCWYCWYC